MTAAPVGPPPAVNRFEYNLLRILRFLLGHMPADQVAPLLNVRLTPAPHCLSRTCVHLVEDTLAKGIVLALVRGGGWRRDRFLRHGQPVAGRVWERVPLEERSLDFSAIVFEFLVWLTAEKPTDPHSRWELQATDLPPADAMFFTIAYDSLRVLPDLPGVLSGKAVFSRNGLCRLLHPGDFHVPAEPLTELFDPWMTGLRAVLLECLQPLLLTRWLHSERAKGQITDWTAMRVQGTAELAVLSGFLAAVEKSGRLDLARFVLHTASGVMSSNATPEYWTAGLHANRPTRLADRIETERVALALAQQLDTLQRWDRRARSVGYFDEEYAASQMWKAEWEAVRGDELAVRAKVALDRLDPLRGT